MTASELKANYEYHNPNGYFFTRRTMAFFGDKMANYGVRRTSIVNHSGESVDVYELYRRRPVKHGLQDSAYFTVDTFSQTFKATGEGGR